MGRRERVYKLDYTVLTSGFNDNRDTSRLTGETTRIDSSYFSFIQSVVVKPRDVVSEGTISTIITDDQHHQKQSLCNWRWRLQSPLDAATAPLLSSQ